MQLKLKTSMKTNTFRLIKSAIKDKDISLRSKENNEWHNDSEILSGIITKFD